MPHVPIHNGQQLVGSWVDCTLEASSNDMSFAPPLIVVHEYNLGNFHWVLRLLLIAPTREYLLVSGVEANLE